MMMNCFSVCIRMHGVLIAGRKIRQRSRNVSSLSPEQRTLCPLFILEQSWCSLLLCLYEYNGHMKYCLLWGSVGLFCFLVA